MKKMPRKFVKYALIFGVLLIVIILGNNNDETSSNTTHLASDMDLITRSGHPTYYGSVSLAHSVWSDARKGKIIFPDSYDKYSKETILILEAYKNSDLIRGIEIYFSNFEQPVQLSVDEVLKIATTYLPFDIVNKYYKFGGSELIVPDQNNKEKSSYYVVSYHHNGVSDNNDYSGSIDVVIEFKDNKAENLIIKFGTPRWMSSISKNGYHIEKWDCDLRNYK